MADYLVYLLLAWQLLVLVYFLFINGSYTLATIISLFDIRGQLAIATRQHIQDLVTGTFYRPITIIVPAFNEEMTIVTTVTLLLKLRYPEFEIVVVNDGSNDETMARLTEAFRLVQIQHPVATLLPHQPIRAQYTSLIHGSLTVIDKGNGGKADALNAGINVSKYPLFCSVDADSILDSDALMRAAKLFVEDQQVIATGGIVRVLNGCTIRNGRVAEVRAPRRWIECFQSVEYIRGFLTGRTSWNFFNGLLIISGAFGIFRKDMVQAVGGYRVTVGEDMDLVVRLHRHCRREKIPYKVQFVPDPVCWTQVPDDYRSLLKQRNRWQRGLIDSLWHNRGMFLNPRYGSIGLLVFPHFLIFEALGPLIEFIGYLGFILFYWFDLIDYDFALLFLLFAIIWGIWLNIGAIALDNLIFRRYRSIGDLIKLSFFGLIEFAGYRQLMVVERLFATLTCWRHGWGKPLRQELHHETTKRTI